MRAAEHKPLRVGMVIGQLSTGGAEGQLRLLCESADPDVVLPIVYCLSAETEPYGPLLERAGIPVRVLAGGRLGRVAALRRALVDDRVDVVHAWLFIANAFAWAATRGGLPLVTSARNCKRSGRVLDLLNRRAFAASAAIVVNSVQVRDYVTEVYAAPRQRIAVVYNAIDLERFVPRPPGAPPAAPLVVMVGRLVTQKNPQLFVAAATALRERLPNVRFELIGGGPLADTIAAMVRANGMAAHVALPGERRDVPERLRAADLFWLTSDWEGLPNAVIEAMASGLPVVATDVGGTAELIDAGVEGYVVRPGDRAALVERSVEILADPARLARMRLAARARAERFGTTQMATAMQAVYARAVSREAA